jgi:AcrR family transcriptional regulator
MTSAPAPGSRPRGRRPGREDTRGLILEAAREQFASIGYDGASLRGIARAAGVDAALVHHYFEGKSELFVAALEFPANPREVVSTILAGGPEGVGERLARSFLAVWDSPAGRERIGALLRAAATQEDAARMLREFVTREIFGRVVAELGTADAELRAGLAASQMIGLAFLRYVLVLEPLASAPADVLVTRLAPTLQAYLAD